MTTWHIIDCTKAHGVTETIYGPRFVAKLAALFWTIVTGRVHDCIGGEREGL